MERLNILCQRMNRSMIFIWSNATGKRKKKLLRDNIMPIMLMWRTAYRLTEKLLICPIAKARVPS